MRIPSLQGPLCGHYGSLIHHWIERFFLKLQFFLGFWSWKTFNITPALKKYLCQNFFSKCDSRGQNQWQPTWHFFKFLAEVFVFCLFFYPTLFHVAGRGEQLGKVDRSTFNSGQKSAACATCVFVFFDILFFFLKFTRMLLNFCFC